MKVIIKQEKGITLIALVVTIIVILILSGVAIVSLSGEKGILTNAQRGNSRNVYYGAEEQVKLAYMSVKTEIMAQKVANSSYNATSSENTEKLGKIVKSNLNDTKYWAVNYSIAGKIRITYSNPVIKAGDIAEGRPAQNGKVDYEITLLVQDATLEIPSADYQTLRAGDTVYYKDAGNNDIECTVLYDSTGNYGVQIIPRNPVAIKELGNGTGNISRSISTTLFEIAKGVYNDAINILNTAAQNYVIEQPNLSAIAEGSRCVGSLPSNSSAQNKSYYNHVEGTNNYFSSYDGQFNAGEEDAAYTDSNPTNYTVDKAQLDSLGIATIKDTTNGKYYWLASRTVEAAKSRYLFDCVPC